MILMLKKECFALYMFAMQNSSQPSFHLDFGIENQLKQIQSVHLYFCFFCFFFSLNVAFMTLFTSLFPCSFLQWFLDRMADDNWWPMQILIKCPNQIVRQVFSFFLFLLLYKQTNVQYTVLSYQCFCCVYDFFSVFSLPVFSQMFQRLCIHVIQRLRPVHAHLYLQPGMEDGFVQLASQS